ncbi:endolytic transglycosylase MltG [Reichenbachiella versicolor]|uniref:endolytic transglycosylase MltG n=1 Tax=Reichenbachiella versicolor TaxID=1821036 RepID=UPI000D6E3164|nr:endolytic transglycosylase MltG [Reichenbachiella versicolor]
MNKKKVILASVIIAFSVMLSSFGLYFHSMIFSPNFLVKEEDRPLMIPTGATFKDVQNLVHDGRYVSDLLSFSFLSKLMNYDKSVKPGLYVIKKKMSNMQVVRMLRAGEQVPVNVTFNNVRMTPDLPEKITKNLEISEEDFMKLLDNDSLLEANGFDSLTIVGMFIPNTYQMYWNVSPEGLFKKMKNEYDKFWNDERIAKAKEMGLTPKEVSVLASIVQAETVMSDERPIVAGLYFNRLKRGEVLAADPTLVFAAQDFEIRRVLNKHKEIESPFNTYKHKGLPPGPINMPEISSLNAVLNYKKHNYLFMCAKEDFSGYHNFATNQRDHSRNAAKFQRAMNKAGIYR